MQLSEKESTALDLLGRKQDSGQEFSEKETQAFDLISRKSEASDNIVQKAVDRLEPIEDERSFGLRPDGSRKGTGFLGIIQRPDGRVSTELSIGVPIDGKEMDIPLLVPSLNQDEIDLLINNDISPRDIPQSIVNKAVGHAEKRIKAGKSAFLEEGETIEAELPEAELTEESVLKPIGRGIVDVAKETGKKALAVVGSPITIPANMIVGLVKDIKGGSSTGNVDAIRRILALEPKEGDELFVADVLKEFGLTDESMRLPEGTVERLGFVGDIAAFGGVDKAARTISRIITADKPVSVLSKVIDTQAPGIKAGVSERNAGLDPSVFFKEKPLRPNALGVRTKKLITERVFNIDKASLESESFIKNFEVKLSPLEREALPFIRQGGDITKETLSKVNKGNLFDIIKNPSKELVKFNTKLDKY
jgi:hypothetical protein